MRFQKLPVFVKALLGAIGMMAVLGMVYQFPPVQRRLGWRIDAFSTTLRTSLNPIENLPTPVRVLANTEPTQIVSSPTPAAPTQTRQVQASPTPTKPEPTPLPSPTPTPLPEKVVLPAPLHETQDWNNCGPASLAVYLHFYDWDGDQFDISSEIKPQRDDRNVNIDELLVYVYNHISGLNVEFRVGGNVDQLRQLIAAGMPVMIEEGLMLDEAYWANDDLWSGHYLLLTGYDDANEIFIAQDTFRGPNRVVSYDDLDESWKSFNRVYFVLYPPEQRATVEYILGESIDHDANRQIALDAAQAEIDEDAEDALAWFNLGTNLTYFERYDEAVQAFDRAREIGLPQRMLRYQFGPFLAYFHAGYNEDLLALTEYALEVTPNSEEALLWRGWALYRANDRNGAVSHFNQALEERPNYQDALYALNYVSEN
jgi:tetratricopeptide (TPR) repeat protein